jgi:hypothetical protein
MAITKIVFDNFGQVTQSQDYFRDAILLEVTYRVFQKWVIKNRQHRFRNTIGEWPQSQSLTAGKDNRFTQGIRHLQLN